MFTNAILQDYPIYLWKIRCIDRESKRLFDRYLVLSPPAQSSENQIRLALETLARDHRDPAIINYRHLFKEISEEESGRLFASEISARGASCFSIHGYFEDKAENPLDEVELMAILSGRSQPVILGNVESILLLGPSSIKAGEVVTQEESDDVIHFIQAMGIIQRGRWWKSTLSLSSTEGVVCPDLDSTVCALALLRQFFLKRDRSFQMAVDIYLRAVDDPRKAHWVDHELNQFNAQLKRVPFGPTAPKDEPIQSLTCEEIIDLFVYGTGLFHRKSDKLLEDRLMILSQQVSRENLLFRFHSACRDVLKHPFRISRVLYSEFAHWTNSGACPRPNRVVVESLFRSSAIYEDESGK